VQSPVLSLFASDQIDHGHVVSARFAVEHPGCLPVRHKVDGTRRQAGVNRSGDFAGRRVDKNDLIVAAQTNCHDVSIASARRGARAGDGRQP
jgi:hypothetical protein